MKTSLCMLAVLAIFACISTYAKADTYDANWNAAGTQQWETAATWQPDPGNTSGGTFPNAEGDVALFQSTSINGTPAQTINRTVNLNNSGSPTDKTLGVLTFNLDGTSGARNVINFGTGGKIIMDGAGSTNAQINVSNSATAMGLDTLAVPIQVNDQLQVSINSIENRSDHLNLRFQGAVTGNGGITRLGPVNTLLLWSSSSSGVFQYTGPTYLGDPVSNTGGGRNQFSPTTTPTASSALYVVGNAQLGMATGGTFQFGAANAPIYFNSDGTGNSGGLGALRPERTASGPTQVTITNTSVVLQAPVTTFHSEGQSANGTDPSLGWIQLTGVISGGASNKLQLTTTSHSANHGSYVLSGANTFSGGIDLYAGRLSTDILSDGGNFDTTAVTSFPNATFGTGDIHVIATPSNIATAISRLTIPSGVVNAIGDHATLSIDGLNDVSFRSAFAELGNGIDEVVGKLVLAGTTQLSGVSYGSSTSTALFQNDTFFTGGGEIQVGTPGDFNGDGNVDGGDYDVWRKSYSANTALYDLWRANYGNVAPGSGSGGGGLTSGSVPEPSTLALLALAVAPLWNNRRRRFASR